jgi:hypothetical protein
MVSESAGGLAATLVYLLGAFLCVCSTNIERFAFVTGQNSAKVAANSRRRFEGRNIMNNLLRGLVTLCARSFPSAQPIFKCFALKLACPRKGAKNSRRGFEGQKSWMIFFANS